METGRKYGGMRGLGRLQRVAAQVPEGISAGGGEVLPREVWDLNPRLVSPAYSTRTRREPR